MQSESESAPPPEAQSTRRADEAPPLRLTEFTLGSGVSRTTTANQLASIDSKFGMRNRRALAAALLGPQRAPT